MNRLMGGLILVAWLLGPGAPVAWGQDKTTAAPAQDRVDEVLGRYNLHPTFAKAGRGLANFFCGWLEIPINMQQRYSMHDTAGSLFTGLAYGILKGVVRTGVGAYETVTFFLPYPEDFAPILPTLAYFQRDQQRPPLPLEW